MRNETHQLQLGFAGVRYTHLYLRRKESGSNRLTGFDDNTASYQYNAQGQRSNEYAQTPYQLTADLNADGEVTHSDLRLLVAAVKRGEQPPEYDLNQDGRVDFDDARCFRFKIDGFRPPISNKGTNEHNIFEPPTCNLGEWIFLGENRYFVYQGANLLGEYNDQGEPRQEIFWMNHQPVGLIQDDALYFIHSDHLGAPRAITDANQRIVWRWESRPFGDSPAEEDPDGDGRTLEFNLRFPGQYYDQETGLFYNYFRYYDPSTGRYLSSDPIGLGGGLNSYAYASSNSLVRSDSYGLLDGIDRLPPIPDGVGPSACSYYDNQCDDSEDCYGNRDDYACSARKCCESFGNNPESNCTRKCLIDKDKDRCYLLSGEARNKCRKLAHVVCYTICRNIYDAVMGGFGFMPPIECRDAADSIGGLW